MWKRSGDTCAISTTFDFCAADCLQFSAHWLVCSVSAGSPARGAPFSFADSESEHRARWKQLWGDYGVYIDAKGEGVELGIKYAVFQLMQHGVGSQNRTHGFMSPARGLTGTYHSGATFFDNELHKCIFWMWVEPSVARAFIEYRYHGIEKAIEFAKNTGFRGARFPEASNDHGAENGPHYVLSYPSAEVRREWSVDEVLHISADVCYALYRYWLITGDNAYMNACGGEVVLECARFAASAFKWSCKKNAYVVDYVMGPDEYHYHVSNSFYTNYMLRWAIQFAVSLVDRGLIHEASVQEVDYWRVIIGSVYLPWMRVDGVLIPEEFEGYAALPETKLRVEKIGGPQFLDDIERSSSDRLENFNSKLIKQADIVLLMSLFPGDFSDDIKRTAFEFYEPRTVHESSLSYGPHAMVAADIGETSDCAYFITRASRYDLDFIPVTDYSNGLHLSAYAGAWQGLAEGLAGLRVEGNRLTFRPRLPPNWNSYGFTICFRGRRLRITVPADGAIDIDSDGSQLSVMRHSDGRLHSCGEF
ncbi:glycoside hydrolase family 65 protein [Trinickia symbiotica]|uniref:Glycoside hydrolase family 65 protein n=2 Tax=Trinickia symbiotica TaxID=863227 RepID=A0A2N7XBP6_9BURK|nr:glycoside hydrolase family 65 protein [Trinickia symbiotica]